MLPSVDEEFFDSLVGQEAPQYSGQGPDRQSGWGSTKPGVWFKPWGRSSRRGALVSAVLVTRR